MNDSNNIMKPYKLAPISGWLILISITLWMGAIISPINIMITLISFQWILLIYSTLSTFLAILNLVLFLKRKNSFIKWFLVLHGFSIFYSFSAILFNSINIPSRYLGSMSHITVLFFIFSVIVNIAFILYVLRSARVKSTFVN